MRMSSVLMLWLGMISLAGAQSVHKCADGRGGHSYQSQPCAQGEPLRTWAVEVPPGVAAPVRSAATPVPARRDTAVATRRPATRRTSASRRDDRHARCVAARANRTAVLRQLGTRRRYDDLRRLNEQVSAVCNHRGG